MAKAALGPLTRQALPATRLGVGGEIIRRAGKASVRPVKTPQTLICGVSSTFIHAILRGYGLSLSA